MSPLLIFEILWAILIIAIFGTMAIAGLYAAPWVPLQKKNVRRMLEAAEVKQGEQVYDLGCGDGRILIIAAKEFKAEARGFDISFLPWVLSKIKIFFLPSSVKRLIRVEYKNFFRVNLKDADVITLFLTPMALKKLEPKLMTELKKSARIVSFVFKFPNLQPIKIDKPTPKSPSIYLYTI